MSFFNRRNKDYRIDEELELDDESLLTDAEVEAERKENEDLVAAMTAPHVYDENFHWADVAMEDGPEVLNPDWTDAAEDELLQAYQDVANSIPDPPDKVTVKWVGHLERDDGRLIVIEIVRGTKNTINNIYLVQSTAIKHSYAAYQELPLDDEVESVYNDLVQYVNNQVLNLKVEDLNYVLLQLLNRAVCFLPDELTPQKLNWVNRRIARRNIQL